MQEENYIIRTINYPTYYQRYILIASGALLCQKKYHDIYFKSWNQKTLPFERKGNVSRSLILPCLCKSAFKKFIACIYVFKAVFRKNSLVINKKSEPNANRQRVRILSLWWSIAGSNRWPLHCQCSALPAELMPRFAALSEPLVYNIISEKKMQAFFTIFLK